MTKGSWWEAIDVIFTALCMFGAVTAAIPIGLLKHDGFILAVGVLLLLVAEVRIRHWDDEAMQKKKCD